MNMLIVNLISQVLETWVAPLMVWSLAVTHYCNYQSCLFSLEFCPKISNVKSRTVIDKSMNFDLKTNIIYPQCSHFSSIVVPPSIALLFPPLTPCPFSSLMPALVSVTLSSLWLLSVTLMTYQDV